MVLVEFKQYLHPDGRTKPFSIDITDALRTHVEGIKSVGAKLECEILSNGVVSFTITNPQGVDFNPEGVDFDIELSPNGPEVLGAVDRLIRRFKQEEYQAWKEKGE